MEILFWKVFHNQYLLNKIIHFIHTTEWIEYKQVSDIHINNRIKFKDITKLDWFINNEQYKLLQYKLKQNENIIIDQESVESLFSGLKFEEGVDGQETDQYQILFEILVELLTNKRNQIEICDLTKVAVKCNNFKVFNLLINEPFSIKVYPSILEVAIEYSNCKLFQLVLDILKSNYGKINISEEQKERSLQLASKNIGQYEEMIQFILSYDNGVLYNDKPMIISSPIDDEIKKIDFKVFISIKSYKVKNKLIELDVVSRKITSNRLIPSIDIKPSITYEALVFSIRVNCKYNYSIEIESKLKSIDEMVNQTESEKIKLLHKLIITQIYPGGYIDYLILYNETINEQFKNNLFSNNGDDEDTTTTHPIDLCYSKNDGSDESKLMVLFRYICELKIRFIGSTDKNQFIEKMKESNQMVKQGKLKWYPILDSLINDSQSIHRVLHIKDKEILDWVSQSNNELIHFLIYHYSNRIRFETLELLEYAHSKECIANITIPLNGIHAPLLVLESSFRWHFINAVNQCDIKTLEYIDSKKLKFAGNHFDSAQFVSNNVELDHFLVLLNYLNQSNFKSFTFNTLTCFCNEIVVSVNLIKSESLQQIKMNLSSFPQDKLMEMIVNSTVAYFNMNLFQLLVNSVESPILSNQQASRFINTNKIFDKYSQNLFQYDFTDKHGHKVNQIITIIKLLVDKHNNPSLETDSKTTYSIFINHFFKKLIRCKGVEFGIISELVELFSISLIEISKDTYNSFYFLHIKNVKLSKYVIQRPGLSVLLQEYSNGEGQPAGVNHSKFSKYLSPDIFTYEFIFGANQSFETILNQLITSISHCSIKDRCLVNRTSSYSIETLNYDLLYCLEIKRVDLFFKQLDFIGQQIRYSNLKDEKDYDCFQDKRFPTKSFTFNSPALSVLSKDNFLDKYDQILFKSPTHLVANGEMVDDGKEELEYKYPTIIYSFGYTSKVMELICQVLNVHQFKRFLCIDFNFHKFGFHNELCIVAAKCYKWDIVSFILDNFSVNLFNLGLNQPGVIDNYNEINLLISRYFKLVDKPHLFQKNKQQHIEESFSITFQHLLNKYFQLDSNIEKYNQFIDPISTPLVRYELLHEALTSFDKSNNQINNEQRDQLSNDKSKSLIEIFKQQSNQQLFKSILHQNNQNNLYSNDDESLEINCDNGDNEFHMYFIRGNIQICDLILNTFPKQFKITSSMMSKAILRDNIHILNHYSKIINQDDELSEHLKYIISRHKDYGQINFNFKKSSSFSPLITQPSFFNPTYLFNVLLSYWNYLKSLFKNN